MLNKDLIKIKLKNIVPLKCDLKEIIKNIKIQFSNLDDLADVDGDIKKDGWELILTFNEKQSDLYWKFVLINKIHYASTQLSIFSLDNDDPTEFYSSVVFYL